MEWVLIFALQLTSLDTWALTKAKYSTYDECALAAEDVNTDKRWAVACMPAHLIKD